MAHLSFECFPPKTEAGERHLEAVAEQLGALAPDFFSVTFATGGKDAEKTTAAVARLRSLLECPVYPHIACVAEAQLRQIVEGHLASGIGGMVVLRGDQPAGLNPADAVELVRWLRAHYDSGLRLFVAAYPEIHPQAASAVADVQVLKDKADAGADVALTQLFYNPDAYGDLLERCGRLGVNIPIVPGVMPIASVDVLLRIADSSGVEIPRWMRERLQREDGASQDDDDMQRWGLEMVVRLCERLRELGAPGFHFYCMNKVEPMRQICAALGMEGASG